MTIRNTNINMRKPSSALASKDVSCEFSQTLRIWVLSQQSQHIKMTEWNKPMGKKGSVRGACVRDVIVGGR